MGSGVRGRYIGEEGVRGKERGEVSWERPCASWSSEFLVAFWGIFVR
jgi:hypothetical protein